MNTFLLIRHGNSTAGETIPGRSPGVHLSEEGVRQAQYLSRQLASLRLDAVYSSPLERTMETAAHIKGSRRLAVTPDESFIEIDFGIWTGCSFEQLESVAQWKLFHEFRTGTRIPGGECIADVQTRMITGLDRLRAKHPDQTIAVVSHGDPIRSVVAYYSGIPLDMALRVNIDTCSVSALTIAEWGPRFLCINGSGECVRMRVGA